MWPTPFSEAVQRPGQQAVFQGEGLKPFDNGSTLHGHRPRLFPDLPAPGPHGSSTDWCTPWEKTGKARDQSL